MTMRTHDDRPDDAFDLILLRRMRDDHTGPTPAEVEALAARVVRAADDRAPVSLDEARRRRIVTPLRAALVAGVTALALLAPAAVGALWPNEQGSVSAAALLDEAADELIASETGVGPGQWVHVVSEMDYAHSGGQVGDRVDEFYIPYDIRDDWYRVWGGRASVQEEPVVEVVAGGVSEQERDPRAPDAGWFFPTPEFIATVPRDTEELRADLYAIHRRSVTDGNGAHRQIWGTVQTILNGGNGQVLPADVRAGIYRVLATFPGVLVEEDVELGGREGVGFGRVDSGIVFQIVIDVENGQYLGTRNVEADGTVSYQQTLTHEVVDEIPDDIRRAAVPK
jgi:hypothetical protein